MIPSKKYHKKLNAHAQKTEKVNKINTDFFDQACKGHKLLEVEDEANLRSLSRPLSLTMSSPDASASAPSSSPACVPLAEEERREHLQVDHVGEGGEGDERRAVEMSVAVVEQEGGGWSEDSDPDSPASEPREGCGNGFTSDSDSDSTIRYETTVTRA